MSKLSKLQISLAGTYGAFSYVAGWGPSWADLGHVHFSDDELPVLSCDEGTSDAGRKHLLPESEVACSAVLR